MRIFLQKENVINEIQFEKRKRIKACCLKDGNFL